MKNNMELLKFLVEELKDLKPSKQLSLRAIRHMGKSHKKDLFSKNKHSQKNAEGHWFEAMIYEKISVLSEKSENIFWIIRKGADAPSKKQKHHLGQNGFSYDLSGNIIIRGNGQDLAEIDLLLLDADFNITFIEVSISKQNLKDFDKEIFFKRKLIKEVTGQQEISFLLISSIDLSRNSLIKRLLSSPNNYYVCTGPFEEVSSIIGLKEVRDYNKYRSDSTKLIGLTDVEMNPNFNYKERHDRCRRMLFKSMKKKESLNNLRSRIGTSSIVTKVLLGTLPPSGVKIFCGEKKIIIDDRLMKKEDVFKYISKFILAVSLPELRLTLYLKVQNKFLKVKRKKTYLKCGAHSIDTFKFEKNIPVFVGFYRWLNSITATIDPQQIGDIVQYFMTEELVFPKRRYGKPNIKMKK